MTDGPPRLSPPLWSTERQRLVAAGNESRRVDKIEALVREWPESLQWLRVCLKNSGGGGNCGRCRKCARTMAALAVLGALGQSRLFPPALSRQAPRELERDQEAWLLDLMELAHRVAPGPARAAREHAGGRGPVRARRLERELWRRLSPKAAGS
ncbi:MAG TPA: hypothetical protein VEQ10_18095 [Vicinamibacteria bacterium]|nr:hypothetical protein [Vicinamibacteria bacterium]